MTNRASARWWDWDGDLENDCGWSSFCLSLAEIVIMLELRTTAARRARGGRLSDIPCLQRTGGKLLHRMQASTRR